MECDAQAGILRHTPGGTVVQGSTVPGTEVFGEQLRVESVEEWMRVGKDVQQGTERVLAPCVRRNRVTCTCRGLQLLREGRGS